MKKRFVICLQESFPEKDEMFIEYVREQKVAWWHYLKTTWLIVDSRGSLSAKDLRTKAYEIFGTQVLVIEIQENGDTWSGHGFSNTTRNMFTWIHENWKK